MNKKEMVARLAKVTGLSQIKSAEVVNALFDAEGTQGIIASAIHAGEKVTIPGFGTFAAKNRAPRTGTSPSSGKKIEIPPRRYASFKPGKTLKELVATGAEASAAR